MRRIIQSGSLLFAALLLLPISQALAATDDGVNGHPGTVDHFTPAQKARAFEAATEAGYTPTSVETFQDGNFFLRAKKGGENYQMTVLPSGQVYPSKQIAPAT